MGRSYLSVKLAIAFAIVVSVIMATAEQVWTEGALLQDPAGPAEPALVCEPAVPGARPTASVVAISPEMVDALPMWQQPQRRICGPRTS